MKITRETLLAMQNGIKTKELEVLKQLNKGNIDKTKIKESYEKSDAVSSKDLDINKLKGYVGEVPPEVSTDAILALMNGKKAKEIMSEGNAFITKDKGVEGLLTEEAKSKLPKAQIAPYTPNPSSNMVVSKEDMVDVVYEILGEILGVSNEHLKDNEYVKKKLSEVYAFIKLRESLL